VDVVKPAPPRGLVLDVPAPPAADARLQGRMLQTSPAPADHHSTITTTTAAAAVVVPAAQQVKMWPADAAAAHAKSTASTRNPRSKQAAQLWVALPDGLRDTNGTPRHKST